MPLLLLPPPVAPAAPPTPTGDIEVRVFDASNTTELVALGDRLPGATWQEQLSEFGTVRVSLDRDDPGLNAVAYNRVLRFYLYGNPVFAGLIEHNLDTVLSTEEDAGQQVNLDGPGLMGLWAGGIVYPDQGLDLISPTSRSFDWTSPDYDDSAWGLSVSIPLAILGTSPANWPDPAAEIMWLDYPFDPHPGGQNAYFRKTFTLGSAGVVRFSMTGDDAFDFYLDGARMTGESRGYLWRRTSDLDVALDAGTHQVALRGTNLDLFPNTAAWVLFTVRESIDGGASFGAPLIHSDDTWAAHGDPAPGMTPGEIIRILNDEWQARGGPVVTLDFDDDVDSDGSAWPEIDVAYSVLTSYSDVLRQLCEESIEVAMDPIGLTLHAWVTGGRGVNRNALTGMLLEPTIDPDDPKSMSGLTFDGIGPDFNVALIRDLDGRWRERSEAVSLGVWGRNEVGLSLGTAPSSDAVSRIADAVLRTKAYPSDHVTWQLEDQLPDGTAMPVPYRDFDVGDLVGGPARGGGTNVFRIEAVTVGEDAEGNVTFAVEL